ncbi:MAG: helix-turn-helix transcriptional regulator [Syntrophomonadaceae bacterium]|nr:helix-turn-helix transcriptional regulator [Syntrophomonadaceae bacterium]
MTDNSVLTPLEVANILKITKNTVYELIKRGELNAYRVGKKVRVDMRDIEEYKNRTKNLKNTTPENSTRTAVTAKQNPLSIEQTSSGNDFIICGQDAILDILSRHLELRPQGVRALRSYIGSYNGLYALYQGKAQVATAHMWDGETNQYNTPYVRRMLPGIPAVIFNLAGRTQGFYVANGNPKGIKSWEDLKRKDISIINREKGSGVRILLDEHLRIMGMTGKQLKGYEQEYSSHLAVASAVARGEADVGVGNEKTGLQVKGVDFLPLQKERLDLIIKKEDLDKPAFEAIIEIIRSQKFKAELEGIGGYDLAQTGEIVAET